MKKYLTLLSQSPLFQEINQDTIPNLLQCLDAKEQTYQKNEIILAAGEPVTFVGFVVDGSLQVIKDDIFGNRTIVTTAQAGSLFAESFACAKVEISPVTVLSEGKSTILTLNFHKILKHCTSDCTHHTKLIENILYILAGRNLFLNEKLEILSKRSSKEKVLAYLSSQANLHGSNPFTIPLNRQGMADYLCLDRSALSSVLAKLQEDGLIRYYKDEFELLS